MRSVKNIFMAFDGGQPRHLTPPPASGRLGPFNQGKLQVSFALWITALVVGLCIGMVGVGGILLVPALVLFADISIHQASATALFTFLFTGVYGSWLFHQRGSINWRISLPICVGAVIFSYLGAWVNATLSTAALSWIIALITISTGMYLFTPANRHGGNAHDARTLGQIALLLSVGAVAGFGSGLSGAGGPLFSVPLMLLLGFTPLTAIGTGQVLQVVAASFGSLGNLRYGSIDLALSGWLIVGELIGVFIGAYVAHRIRAERLRFVVAGLCILAGGWILLRA